MNLQQLEYLVALRQHRHFVNAAEACGVTQPTLSAMIARLERELGLTLVDRSAQPLGLTSVGERICDEAQKALNHVRAMRELADEEVGGLKGRLRIGILPTIAPFLLPRLKPMAQHAGLQLQFAEHRTAECERQLLKGELDLAIIAGDHRHTSMECHPLYYEEFVGYVSARDPLFDKPELHSSELDPSRLLLLDEGHCFRDQLLRFCHLRPRAPRSMEFSVGGIETFMRLIESGRGGVTFVPELAIETMSVEQKKLLRPFTPPRPARPVMLLRSPLFQRESLVELITQWLRESVPARMRSLGAAQVLATRI